MKEDRDHSPVTTPKQVFSRRKVLACTTAAGLAACAGIASITRRRLAAAGPLDECRRKLRLLSLTLFIYQSQNGGTLPPAVVYGPDGTPWHSWRALIIPYIDKNDWARRYRRDEPWDGPNNRRLPEWSRGLGEMNIFRCPADVDAPPNATSYLAVKGDRTLWPLAAFAKTSADDDGVLLIAEVCDSQVHWLEPRDLDIRTMTLSVNISGGDGIRGRHDGAVIGAERLLANVALFDSVAGGEVRSLDSKVPPESVKSLLLRDDGPPRR